MNTKLTLRLNSIVIQRAKNWAKKNKTSLSKMIESYLNSVTRQKSEDIEITPLIESLSGIIELPENYDHRKEYSDHISEKYK
jgi:hypothetical protein